MEPGGGGWTPLGDANSRAVRLERGERHPCVPPPLVGPRESLDGAAGSVAVPDAEKVRSVAEEISHTGVAELQGSLSDLDRLPDRLRRLRLRRLRGLHLLPGLRREVAAAVPALDGLVPDLFGAEWALLHFPQISPSALLSRPWSHGWTGS